MNAEGIEPATTLAYSLIENRASAALLPPRGDERPKHCRHRSKQIPICCLVRPVLVIAGFAYTSPRTGKPLWGAVTPEDAHP